MLEIIPSPGTQNKDWVELEKRIEIVKPFVKTIHIDVVDGKFAPNTTLSDSSPFAKYTKDLQFEIHLMVEEPIHHLKKWADAGFVRFIGQIEKMSDQVEFVAQGQLLGEVVLAVDKQTPIDAIRVPLDDLDGLLVMTIQAGFSGQQFEEPLLEKIKQLRARTNLPIEVDGGINDKTVVVAAHAGATRFVATSAIYNVPDPYKAYLSLKEAIA